MLSTRWLLVLEFSSLAPLLGRQLLPLGPHWLSIMVGFAASGCVGWALVWGAKRLLLPHKTGPLPGCPDPAADPRQAEREAFESLMRHCLFPLLLLVPAAFLHFTAPADLGLALECLAFVAVFLRLADLVQDSSPILRRPRAFLLGLALLASAALAGSLLAEHNPLTGDEPAYLVMASSLIRDLDLDVGNNYRQRDYREFGVDSYPTFAHRGTGGRFYPHHGAGLGLLLAPVLPIASFLERRVGMGWGIFLLRLIPGCLLGLYLMVAFDLSRALGARKRPAFGVAVAFGLSCPLLFYSTQLYPDLPAGLMLGWLALLWVRLARVRDPDERATLPLLAMSASLAMLPLLGVKFLLPGGLLGMGLLWRFWRRQDPRGLVWALAGGIVGCTAFFWLLGSQTGTFSPAAAFGGAKAATQGGGLLGHFAAGMGARLRFVPWWLFGYLMDQRTGLFFLAPFMGLGIAGLFRNGSRDRSSVAAKAANDDRGQGSSSQWFLLLIAGSYMLVYAYHLDWGGRCPPGRPMVGVLWSTAPFVALGIGLVPAWGRRILFGLSGLISLAYALDHKTLFLHLHPNAQSEFSPLLQNLSLPRLPLAKLAPFVSVDHTWTVGNSVGLLLLAALAGWCWRLAARPSSLAVGKGRFFGVCPETRARSSFAARSLALPLLAAATIIWGLQINPESRLQPLVAQDPDCGRVLTGGGALWRDGWVPPRLWWSFWVRLDSPASLQFTALQSTMACIRGRRLHRRLDLDPASPREVQLPDSWIGRLERLEIWVEAGVVPALLSRSPDKRNLGARIALRCHEDPGSR